MDTLINLALIAVFAAVAVAYILMWLRTWQDIQRSDLNSSSKGMWSLAILVFQFFGPLAWWWAGPRTRHRV